ncbi:MAG: hypothetical protein HKO87_00565 [Acidimicrobiia bacterium]|nr:hypothetical protein [Acidimicrobiia bacterium]
MKKLIRFLLFVGGIAIAVWYLKNELVPTPQSARGPAPHFRTPDHNGPPPVATTPPSQPTTPSEPSTPDDLTAVKGIGPVYAGRLRDLGIATFAALAAADPAAIADALDVSPEQVSDWIDQASRLA